MKFTRYFLIALLIIFGLTSCEKDFIESSKETATQQFKYIDTLYDFNQIKHAAVKKSIKNIEKMSSQSFEGRPTEESDTLTYNGISINKNFIVYYQDIDSDYHSYTFPVLNDPEGGGFDNILISYHIETNSYKDFLVHYEVTEGERDLLNAGEEIEDLEEKVTFEELDENYFSQQILGNKVYFNPNDGCSYYVDYYPDRCCSGLHTYADGNTCDYVKNGDVGCIAGMGGTYFVTLLSCSTSGGGEPPSPPPSSTNGPNHYNGSNSHSTFAANTNNYGGQSFKNFLKALSIEERAMYDSLLLEYKQQIQSFLNQQGYSQENIAFVLEAMQFIAENPDFNLDIDRSYNSPFNIDLSDVEPDPNNPEPEKEKFMYIYDKLLETTFFKDVMEDVFEGDDTKMNIKFKIDDIPANGHTNYNIIRGNDIADNIITVILDKDYLLNQPLITVAKTLVHETVHVQMALLATDNQSGNFPGTITETETNQLIDVISQGNSHGFIGNHYLPTLKSAVQELLPKFEPQTRINQISNENLYTDNTNPNSNNIIEQWNWDNFFTVEAMEGLNSTDFHNDYLNNPNNDVNHTKYDAYRKRFYNYPSDPYFNNLFKVNIP